MTKNTAAMTGKEILEQILPLLKDKMDSKAKQSQLTPLAYLFKLNNHTLLVQAREDHLKLSILESITSEVVDVTAAKWAVSKKYKLGGGSVQSIWQTVPSRHQPYVERLLLSQIIAEFISYFNEDLTLFHNGKVSYDLVHLDRERKKKQR